MIPSGKSDFNAEPTQQRLNRVALQSTGVLRAWYAAEDRNHVFLEHDGSRKAEITPQRLAHNELAVLHRPRSIRPIPLSMRLGVSGTSTRIKEAMTFLQWFRRVAMHHAVAGQRKVSTAVPAFGIRMRRQVFQHLKYSNQPAVDLVLTAIYIGLTVPPRLGHIDHSVARSQAWSKLPCTAETRDRRELALQIGFPPDRTVHKRRDAKLLRRDASGGRRNKRCIRVDVVVGHAYQGTSGRNA